MIALVRGVSLASMARVSSCQVSGLESTKTGLAPQYFTALAVATKVRLGSSTSSCGPTPTAARAGHGVHREVLEGRSGEIIERLWECHEVRRAGDVVAAPLVNVKQCPTPDRREPHVIRRRGEAQAR